MGTFLVCAAEALRFLSVASLTCFVPSAIHSGGGYGGRGGGYDDRGGGGYGDRGGALPFFQYPSSAGAATH